MDPRESDALDHAVARTRDWFAAVAELLGSDDPGTGQHALRSVLHLLREQLPIAVSAGLGARLPMLIRGMYYEGWEPHADKPRARHTEEFLGLLERALRAQGERELDPEVALQAVFVRVAAYLQPHERRELVAALPPGLRLLVDRDVRDAQRSRSAAGRAYTI